MKELGRSFTMRDSVGVWNNVGMELRHVGWVGLDILIAAVEVRIFAFG